MNGREERRVEYAQNERMGEAKGREGKGWIGGKMDVRVTVEVSPLVRYAILLPAVGTGELVSRVSNRCEGTVVYQ